MKERRSKVKQLGLLLFMTLFGGLAFGNSDRRAESYWQASATETTDFNSLESPPFSNQWEWHNAGQTVCNMRGKCQQGIAGRDTHAISAWKIHHDCRNV